MVLRPTLVVSRKVVYEKVAQVSYCTERVNMPPITQLTMSVCYVAAAAFNCRLNGTAVSGRDRWSASQVMDVWLEPVKAKVSAAICFLAMCSTEDKIISAQKATN